MKNMPDSERLKIIELRILNEVSKYYQVHSQGMAMQSLSYKFGRALEKLGGFPEKIQNLELEGLIYVQVLPSAARIVFPAKMKPKDEYGKGKGKKVPVTRIGKASDYF